MDKTRKIQISLFVIGLFLMALAFSIPDYFDISNRVRALFWGIGVVFALTGITYRTIQKNRIKKGTFDYREGWPKTDVEILGYVGLAVMLASFVIGLLKIGGTSVSTILFFVLLAVSMVMMLISNILVRKQKLREIKKAKYGH